MILLALSFSVSLSLQSFWSSSRAEKPQPKSLITNLPRGGKKIYSVLPSHTRVHTHSCVQSIWWHVFMVFLRNKWVEGL